MLRVAFLLKKNKVDTIKGLLAAQNQRIAVEEGGKVTEVTARNIILATVQTPAVFLGLKRTKSAFSQATACSN